MAPTLQPLSETPCVAQAAQAALLLDVRLRPLLALLMHAPRTATDVAERLGMTVKRAHYLLTRLELAGAAQIVAHEPRRGRPLRRYATASRWFIPFEVTGAETVEAFLAEQILPRMAEFTRLSARKLLEHSPDWGYWLERGEHASHLQLGNQHGPAEALFYGAEPFLLNIGTVHLNSEQAGEMKRRMLAVLEEFSALEGPETPAYTIGLLLVRGDVG
ncbi:DprA-like winged helix domain-containing protein [Deinococcus sp. UYEF24]